MTPPLTAAFVGHIGNSVTVRGGLEVLLNMTADALAQRGVRIVRRVGESDTPPDVVVFVGCFYGLLEAFEAAKDFPRVVLPIILLNDDAAKPWRRQVDRARAFAPSSLLGARRTILRGADAVVANSEEEAENSRAYGGRNVFVLRCGVDLDKFRPAPPDLSTQPAEWRERAEAWLKNERRVVCVGRFERRKNQLEVIEACRAIGASVLLIGRPSPTEASYCEQLFATEKAPDVNIWRDAPVALVRWAMAQSHAHVLASRHETIGLVSLEAAASGCRPVAIDQPTSREYLHPFGELAASPKPEELGVALSSALRRGRLGDAERALLEPVSWSAFATRMEDVLRGAKAAFDAAGRGSRGIR